MAREDGIINLRAAVVHRTDVGDERLEDTPAGALIVSMRPGSGDVHA